MPNGLSRMIIVLSVTSAVGLLFIGTMGAASISDESGGTQTAMNQTESLAPVLDELTEVSDPDAFANARDIHYDDDNVTVVVELEEGAELPAGYDATVEQSYSGAGETLVEASVPVDQLHGLAAVETVDYVRLPREATPMTDEQSMSQTNDPNGAEDNPSTSISEDLDGTTDDTGTDGSDRSTADTDSSGDADDTLGSWLPAIVAVAVLLAWAGWRSSQGGVRDR